MEQDKKSSWSVLGRLRTAVKKVTFLLNFSINRWRLASSMFGDAASLSNRRLSFNDRLGLTAIVSSSSDDEDHYYNWDDQSPYAAASSQTSPDQVELQKTRSFPLQRTTSFPEEDDIDKRADMFISNFYRQLRMERQVSLQLRYRRDPSFDSSNSFSP